MRATLLCLVIATLLWVVRIVYSIVRWKAYRWLRLTVVRSPTVRCVADQRKHLIFTMVDHYEPGCGERGALKNERWLEAFRPISDSHRDTAGNHFRYTWFYPYDHRNEMVLVALCNMAHNGYGEVELHWHHPLPITQRFQACSRRLWHGSSDTVRSFPHVRSHVASSRLFMAIGRWTTPCRRVA